MFVFLLRALGLTPGAVGKTGSREAAWALICITTGLQIGAMWLGPEMVTATMPVMIVLWPAAITALAGAYKLKYDRQVMLAAVKDKPDNAAPNYPDDFGSGAV